MFGLWCLSWQPFCQCQVDSFIDVSVGADLAIDLSVGADLAIGADDVYISDDADEEDINSVPEATPVPSAQKIQNVVKSKPPKVQAHHNHNEGLTEEKKMEWVRLSVGVNL